MFTFPLHWPYPVFPVDRATNLSVLLCVLCSGLTMYLFARRILTSPSPAFFCGVAYMLSHRCLSMVHAGWLLGLGMYPLVPLLFWSLDRLIERPTGGRIGLFAIAVALSLIQGQLQLFYYALLALLAFLAYRFPAIDPPNRPAVIGSILVGGMIAGLLSAPDLLPRLELVALSTRGWPDYSFFLNQPVSLADLKTLFDPFDQGGQRDEYWENNFYFGLALLPLCLAAILTRRARIVPLAGAIAAMMVLCFDSPVLRFLFDVLPGFDLFRIPSRVLHVAQFAVILLAGIGIESMVSATQSPRRGKILVGLFVLWVVLDSAVRFAPRLTTRPLDDAFPSHPFHSRLQRDPSNGRTAAVDRLAVPYGMAGYYGIDMANGYASLNLKPYIEYFSVLQTGDPRRVPRRPVVWTDLESISKPDMLRALDVRYLVTNETYPLDLAGYEKIASHEDVPVFNFYEGIVRVPVQVWRDAHPLGPAYFADSIRAVQDESASLTAVATAGSARGAYVFDWDGNSNPIDFSGGTVNMVRRGYNIYMYDIESRGTNFLILSQIWYPGWKASLDGQDLALYRTNHTLLGCVIPPGRHSLELTMTSPKLRQGIVLFALGLVVLAGLLFFPGRLPAW